MGAKETIVVKPAPTFGKNGFEVTLSSIAARKHINLPLYTQNSRAMPN